MLNANSQAINCNSCGPEEMGCVDIFSIPGYRGVATSVDPKVFAEWLKTHEREDNRVITDQQDVKYQDFRLDVQNPHDLLRQVMVDILSQFAQVSGYEIDVVNAWTIFHHKDNQTYPHCHITEVDNFACVYWAQCPEGGGQLEFHPLGLPGPAICITPKPGHFMIFPGDVLHGVRQNLSDELRISMSVNLFMNKKKPLDYSKSK